MKFYTVYNEVTDIVEDVLAYEDDEADEVIAHIQDTIDKNYYALSINEISKEYYHFIINNWYAPQKGRK